MKIKSKIILIAFFIFLATGMLAFSMFFQAGRPQGHEMPVTEVSANTHYDQLPKAHMDMAMHDDMGQQLKTEVTFGQDKISVTNGEAEDWKDCSFEMNATIVQKGYVYTADTIKSNSTIVVNVRDFTRDGAVFNPAQKKANNLLITCSNTAGKMGWSYSSNR